MGRRQGQVQSPKEPNMRWGKVSQRKSQARGNQENTGAWVPRDGISARKRVAAVKATERPAVTPDLAMWRPQGPQPDWTVGNRWEEPAGMLGKTTGNGEPCGKKTQRALWTTGATQPDPLDREKESCGSCKPS